MTTDNFTSMEAADPPRSPSGSAGAQATAAGGDRPLWEAQLVTPGLTSNRAYRPDWVLKRAAPLFVGAPLRIARSLHYGHGKAGHAATAALYSERVRAVWRPQNAMQIFTWSVLRRFVGDAFDMSELDAREDDLARRAGDDLTPYEPRPIGRVRSARFDADEGIVGEVEIDPVADTGGPYEWLGITRPGESVGTGLERTWRRGHGWLLQLSYVVDGPTREALAPDGLPCLTYEAITRVHAVDLVVFAATMAHLIRPLPKFSPEDS
jgi:hypothetical protein